MLSVSRYMAISMIFILIFVIFMAFNPGVYATAPGGGAEETILRRTVGETPAGEPQAGTAPEDEPQAGTARTVSFSVAAGSESNRDRDTVLNIFYTLDTLRCAYSVYDSVASACEQPKSHTLIIAISSISAEETELLRGFLAQGGSVIFAVMPDAVSLASEDLRDLLGILEYRAEYAVEGVELYEDFLLTGELYLESIEFSCYEIRLDGTCRVYATGINPDRDKAVPDIRREDKNPLIWRTYSEGGAIYMVNAPFMERKAGLGILTALVSMTNEDFLYPLVGARVFVLDAFPYIADNEQMVGSRTVDGFMRDIMLPDLTSFSSTMNIVFSCYTNGGFDRNRDSMNTLNFFSEQVYRASRGEVNLAVNADPDVYQSDISRLEAGGWQMSSYLLQENAARTTLPFGATSLLTRDNRLDSLGWISDSAVQAPVISENLTDEAAMDAVGVLSLTGLMIHSIDLAVPIESTDDSDAWNVFVLALFESMHRINDATDFLPSMTMTDAAQAIKNYLNTDYVIERSDNELTVRMEGNTGEMLFAFKTKREIAEGINCIVEEIRDNIYVVRASSPEFTIKLGQYANKSLG